MSATRIRVSGYWPNLEHATCDDCGWEGPTRDVYEPRGKALVNVDAERHECQGGAA